MNNVDDEHTPTPWIAVGSHDIRGANMHLVGMVNPTVKQGRVDREFIIRACSTHGDLVAALKEARDALNGAPNTMGLHAQINAALEKA